MPAQNLIKKFAGEVLQPQHLHIAMEIIETHVDKAMALGANSDKKTLASLFALRELALKAKDSTEPTE